MAVIFHIFLLLLLRNFLDFLCWFMICDLIKILSDTWHVNKHDNEVVMKPMSQLFCIIIKDKETFSTLVSEFIDSIGLLNFCFLFYCCWWSCWRALVFCNKWWVYFSLFLSLGDVYLCIKFLIIFCLVCGDCQVRSCRIVFCIFTLCLYYYLFLFFPRLV